MRLYIFFLILLISSVFSTSCLSKQNSTNTSSLYKIKNFFTPVIVWKKQVGNGVKDFYSKLSPSYEKSIVYVASREGLVKALKLTNGNDIWVSDLSNKNCFFCLKTSALLSSGITIFNDKIFIGTERGTVIALNKKDGKIIWSTDVSGEVLSKPVITNDLAIIHTSNGKLHAIDINNGENKWLIDIGAQFLSLRGVSTPTVSFNILVVGNDNGLITAISLPHGQIIWQKRISKITNLTEKINDIDMTPIIDYNKIYVASYNNILSSLDIYSGKILWTQKLSSINNIIVSGENIYLIDINDCIFSIRKTDGKILWIKKNLLNRHLSEFEIFNGYLVFGDCKGYLHWIDIIDGKTVVQNKLDDSGIQIRPIIIDDKLIVQTNNGTVYLLKI